MSYLEDFYHQIIGPTDGRKWVFVHGLMGYGQNWRKIVSGLEQTECCLIYDQRGHGRSIKPSSGYAPEDYANDLLGLIDELGWEKIILVGHSMGGRNVLNFASRFPQRLEKLVIEDIGPEAAPNAQDYYEYLLNLPPTPFATREEARKYFYGEFMQTAKTREKIETMAAYFYANMIEQPDGTVSWRFSKDGILETVRVGRARDRWDEVRGLQIPTLLVRGAESQELSRENYEEMLSCNKMLTGVEIPGAAHWVHSDQPQAFIEALKNFVGGF
jgi:pimeloyl-ACP methyl ester carboxylesterase